MTNPPSRRRRKRQQPKRSWRARGRQRFPLGTVPPLRHETTTTQTTFTTAPPIAEYSREADQHAVTTNQEPPAHWPDVDLPPLSGFTVDEQPMDNGQANPATIYQPSTVETSPYYDANTGDSDSGSGDLYPNVPPDAEYPPDATDVDGDDYA